MALAEIETRFSTFYSFKGGVGRSMALYNCACVLAGTGRRVLMIDFDLDAPGLTLFLQRHSGKGARSKGARKQAKDAPGNKPGLIELITGFVENPRQWSLGEPDHPERISKYIADLHIPKGVKTDGPKGRLALMPAGRIDDEFGARLGRVHWDTEPLATLRDQLFRHVREVIVKSKLFDYVLIDARTGFSDEGYISARILADDLVVLTGLNDQNIAGTARFLQQVNAWNRKDGEHARRVILIESPVPEWEEEAKRKRRAAVSELFAEYAQGDVHFTLSLPYHPRLALYEELMVADWPDTSLARAYRTLTAMLRSLARDDAERWSREAFEAVAQPLEPAAPGAARPDFKRAMAALETLRAMDPRAFAQAAPGVANVAARSDPAVPEALDLLERLAQWQPDEPLYELERARLLRRMPGEEPSRKAREALLGGVEKARRRGDPRALSAMLHSLADLDRLQGEYDKARAGFTEALETFRSLGDRQGIAASLGSLADLDHLQGEYDKARAGFTEALEINRSLGDPRGIAVTLGSLAQLDLLQGDYDQARAGFTEALEIKRSLGDPRAIALTLHSLAELDRLQGDYDKARAGFTEALKIKRSLGDRREIAVTLHSLAKLDCLQGEYDQARAGFTEALETLRSLGDRRGIAVTLHSLAQLDSLQGDYDKARAGYTEALEIVRSLGDRWEIAVTLHSLADLHRLQGEYDQACAGFTEALEIKRSLGARREIAVTQLYLCVTQAMANPAAGAGKVSDAIRDLDRVGDPHPVARGYALLAQVLRAAGHSDRALDAAGEARRLGAGHGFRGVEADAAAVQAVLLAGRGDFAGAAQAAQEAVAFFDAQSVRHPLREQLDTILAHE